MEKFLPSKNYTKFSTNKKLDILKLDEEIRINLGVERWENNPDKKGFSGITVWETKNLDGFITNNVIVHWTLDGKTGFNIDFLPNIKERIESVINKHIKK